MPRQKKIKEPKVSDKGGIINFYEVIPSKYLNDAENPNFNKHNIKLPFRMCVSAPSGSGKTNFILNLLKIFSEGKGTFVDIFIITANKDEPLYNFLEGEHPSIIIKEGLHNLPKLDDMDKKYNHLVIFDDLVLEKNLKPVCNYYMRARKQNCSVCFLSQSYFDIPSFIRKNSTYLVLFDLGGSKRERTTILKEWSTDLEEPELTAIYKDATSKDLQPLIITGGKTDINKKYRKGWTDYYNVKEFLNGKGLIDAPLSSDDDK
jgi:hypothetical protein